MKKGVRRAALRHPPYIRGRTIVSVATVTLNFTEAAEIGLKIGRKPT